MKRWILALDQGTTSSRALLFDEAGEVRHMAQREFRQSFPRAGWVEHDPEEIWKSQREVARAVLEKVDLREVAGIGITNQRETTIVWNRETGKPIAPAIVWQDRRTAGFCRQLQEEGRAEWIQEKTGLVIDAYFSGSKVRWLLNEILGARDLAERGQLCFGTVDTWLVWKLTGERSFLTDVTNASRTLLFNIHNLEWDEELLALFEVPRSMLPEVRSSSEIYAETVPDMFGRSFPIAGIAGDQQSALFGQACFEPGQAKNTYGTGCFMLMNTGTEARTSRHRLITTVAWQRNGKHEYALEGGIFVAGAVVQWLRDQMGFFSSAAEIEDLARSVKDSDGVYLVPAFAGLGAPHWDPEARGCLIGLTRGTSRAHIARAALEAIAFQVGDVLEVMQHDAGTPLKELRVDGGASKNDLMMQFQADVLGVPVVRPVVSETTALGAACLAGLALGFWKDPSQLAAQTRIDRRFEPSCSRDEMEGRITQWRRAVERSKDWARD